MHLTENESLGNSLILMLGSLEVGSNKLNYIFHIHFPHCRVAQLAFCGIP